MKDAAGNIIALICTYINNNLNIICRLQLSRKCKRIKLKIKVWDQTYDVQILT